MAIKHYVDEIPPADGRTYQIISNGNTSKINDVTEYPQPGTSFGAKDVNSTCILECNYEKVGTVHKLTTENIASENIKFFATDSFKKGDTFTFNGANIAVLTQDGEVPNNDIFIADTMVFGLLKDDVLYLPCNCAGRSYVFRLTDYDHVDLNNLHESYTSVEYIVPDIEVTEYQPSNFPPVQIYNSYGFHFKHLFGMEYFRSFYDYKLWIRRNKEGFNPTAWLCISNPLSD